jgi:hypothetical protein
LDAEHYVAGKARFGCKQWSDHAAPDELLVHRIGLDVLGVETN